jgi:hypothetical protein
MKKGFIGYIVALVCIVAGLLLGFAPIGAFEDGSTVSMFASINYGGLGRICSANLITLIFIGVAFLIVVCAPFMKQSGLKVFLLVLGGLLLLTAGSMYGCALVLFRYHGPVGIGSITTLLTDYTQWGAILACIIVIIGGFVVAGLGLGQIQRKAESAY